MLKIKNFKKVLSVLVSCVLLMSAAVIFPADVNVEAAEDILTNTLINGDFEASSWYAWAGDTVLYENGGTNLTGNGLNGTIWTQYKEGGWVYNGNSSIVFPNWTEAYPVNPDKWNTHETVPGFKTVIDRSKFPKMDLSGMTFSVVTKIDIGDDEIANQIFEFDVKYRAVNGDGSYGQEHVSHLISSVVEKNQWTKIETALDDMTADCENAETIEIELYIRSYCTVFIDDADITASKKPIVDNSLVNGDFEASSWYAWAGDTVLDEKSGQTGNVLNSVVWEATRGMADWRHSDGAGAIFPNWTDQYPTNDEGLHEIIPGIKTAIDESKFAKMDLSDMTFSIWARMGTDGAPLEDKLKEFDMKYRAVYADGSYGSDHTVSLKSSITESERWTWVAAKLDDMTAECENAKTIEVELYFKSVCTVFVDDADITAPKKPIVDNSLVNGDFESGSWYVWAGDSAPDGESGKTGNDLDSVMWNVTEAGWRHSGSGSMIFPDWTDAYPVSKDDESAHENIAGCKTCIDEEKFAQMDLSNLSFSIWIDVLAATSEVKELDVIYRIINNDNSTGAEHKTASICPLRMLGRA